MAMGTYRLSYYLASDGLTTNEFQVSLGGVILTDQTNIPQQGYTLSTFTVTTNGPSVLSFGLRDDPGMLSLDDISLVLLTLNLTNISGLTPNQFSIAQALDAAPIGSATSNAAMGITNAEQIEELSPQNLQILRNFAFDNFGFQVLNLDDHLASLRYGEGGFDASGLQVLDTSTPAMLSQIKSHLLAFNPSPAGNGLVSDVADPVMGGTTMTDPKDVKSMAPAAEQDPWSAFITGSVVLADLSHTADTAHADYTTGGVTAGADYRVCDNFAVGALFAYNHTDADLDNNGSSTRDDSYSPGIYATYANHGWFANALAAYNYNSYRETRQMPAFGTAANGSPDGNQADANFDGGYEFHSGPWTYGPTLGLQYVHLEVNSFNETGAGAFDLGVKEQDDDSLRSHAGVAVRYQATWNKVIFTPHFSASYQHEFMDNSDGITSQFLAGGGGSFTVQGENEDRDSGLFDLGLDTQCNRALSVFVDYQAQAGQSDFFAQAVQAGVKVNF
jgi:uncharacterized protein with beta-barrel porin domain